MTTRSNKGSTKIGVLFFILFCASVALNVILLNGCELLGIGGKVRENNPVKTSPVSGSELSYLRELAEVLEIKEGTEKTPGDIAFDIRQCLNNRQKYSAVSFEMACSAIGIQKDQDIFKAYHAFISKIAGKTIIILE